MSRGDYEDRQRERDREYADAWAKLSAKERKRLAKAGITGPDLPVYHTGKHDQDALLDHCAAPVETPQETATNSGYSLIDVARMVIAELIAHNNIELAIDCLSLVTGLSYGGQSMTDIARKYGISRAAVSKRCVGISDALGLPPSRAMRRLTARQTYARHAKQSHDRNSH
ncbi:hypothetical protein H5P28_15425 [Ruficoccus amylovorans]|uniref:Uncharacterized protein n=1 Tax=Ruficoccus amylovorans TaxID=1804625 RepID=A0A842HI33_9BACT|nr:hypothetical protein [Ruficoccus amylovorans]MBC2595658.1 hypothetical protein [Ruficoccus amylovorans]